MGNRLEVLEKLAALLEKGLLTPEEFAAEKARIMGTGGDAGTAGGSSDSNGSSEGGRESEGLGPENAADESDSDEDEGAPSSPKKKTGLMVLLVALLLLGIAGFTVKLKMDADAAKELARQEAERAERERIAAEEARLAAEEERRRAEEERRLEEERRAEQERAAAERAYQASLPAFRTLDMKLDDSCTRLGDYCLTATCLVENTGGSAGTAEVEFLLTSGTGGEVRGSSSALIAAGSVGKVKYKFREARMSEAARGSCQVLN